MRPEMLELNARARDEGKSYRKKRLLYPKITEHLAERIFLALIGPRGAGKTVILKQLLSEIESSFYISLDTEKPEEGLFAAAKELSERGLKLLLLDEVHYYPGFEHELKKIYDFLGLNVVFTSSSAISLHESSYDLSRRVRIIRVPPFSLREFVLFEKGEELPALPFEGLLSLERAREYYGKVIHVESLFDAYLRGRNYPFTLGKTDFLPLFRNILETLINNDILLSGRATPEESLEIRKMLGFVGNAPAEDISYSSIAKNLGTTRYKAEKYVDLMEKAFVLRRVFPKGSNVLKEPKILLSLPYRLLYRSYADCIGAIREDFFAESMGNLGIEFNYLKSKRGEKIPDYVADRVVFEIGGPSKGASQFKGFSAEKKIILTHPGTMDGMRRPLFLVGMLEPMPDIPGNLD